VKPIKTSETNCTFVLPGGTNDLPCKREGDCVYSAWTIDDQGELTQLSALEPRIVLAMLSDAEPNVAIKVGGGLPHLNGDLKSLVAAETGVIAFAAYLTSREAQAIRDGAHVEIMVAQDPPPPVSVYLD
jgi:hypothetical protein